MIEISQAPNHVAIVGNTLQGVAQNVGSNVYNNSMGIDFYPGGSNIDIVNNDFKNLNYGVSLWSFQGNNGAGNFVPANYVQINGNSFSNVNVGITFIDGTPVSWGIGTLSSSDNNQVIGTTIQNNNLSGVNKSAFSLSTNGDSELRDRRL